ncbi:toll/interleukin-1 receptor domain-containing protein [Arenibacter troitsensis]|uniref:TIR domain-containing protein n=1 Tax=Arenibacter troitsensis TaxID=188872 RepID=A0A1X7JUW0_9FLAO|nr:toll/interleukin-1 receptor domain-containing protein [Arenibacter troitsensis]SMG31598.1 TIR domain-containing protein [Arenibacter troitsensis]
MAYITFNDLQRQTFTKAFSVNESLRSDEKIEKQVFLSYRRKDSQFVRPIVNILKSLGVKIYIDYLDDTLPDKPSSETAAILRSRIKASDKFILMATPNSSESKWIPWELGLGDGFIDYQHVAILPITNKGSYWAEQEYYSIYGYIKKANSKDGSKYDYAIFYPDGNAEWLVTWLRK